MLHLFQYFRLNFSSFIVPPIIGCTKLAGCFYPKQSVCVFSGNQTHGIGIINIMLYWVHKSIKYVSLRFLHYIEPSTPQVDSC